MRLRVPFVRLCGSKISSEMITMIFLVPYYFDLRNPERGAFKTVLKIQMDRVYGI